MTAPSLAHTTPWGRMYGRKIGGEPLVPSITTTIGMEPDMPSASAKPPVLGVKPDMGQLTRWRIREVQTATAAYLRGDDALPEKYPHIVAAVDHARQAGRNRSAIGTAARNAIAATPDVIANEAAERGDRVHEFAEALGQWQLGIVSREVVDEKRAQLDAHGEGSYADVLVDWWVRWGVEAVANEVTVWNHDAQVAGTLDIVFRANGTLVVADFKSKSDSGGHAKAMKPAVGMQLCNALHADEMILDAEAGKWGEWSWREPGLLMGVAVSPTEVVPKIINPDLHEALWSKFLSLRRMWQSYKDLDDNAVLRPARPPRSAAEWPENVLATFPEGVGAARLGAAS